jgi:hypothetical protein
MSGGDPDFYLRARAISEELARVLSNEPATRGSGALEPVLVSFAGRPDALEFLRTIPTGTSRAELERLGAAYCAAHPAPPVTEQDDRRDP